MEVQDREIGTVLYATTTTTTVGACSLFVPHLCACVAPERPELSPEQENQVREEGPGWRTGLLVTVVVMLLWVELWHGYCCFWILVRKSFRLSLVVPWSPPLESMV